MPTIDGLIAAMVTRNTSDMEVSGVALFNPWVMS